MNRSRYYDSLGWGLILFGLTLPLSKSAGNVLLFLICPAVAAGALFYKDIRGNFAPHIKQPLTLAFLLVFLVAFVGVFFSEKYADGFSVSNKFLSLPAIYLMASVLLEAVRDEEKRYKTAESVLMAFLIGLTALNIIGVLTYLGVVGDKKFVLPLAPLHLHWIWFSNINALGLYTAASFLLYPRSAPSRGRTLFLYAFTALAVLGILLSTSRTAWLGILVTSLIMIFIVSRSRRVFFITAAGVAVVCIALYLFIPIIRSRILEIGSDIAKFTAGEAATSLGERFVMWKAAFTMFLSHPIMGVGSGDYVPTVSAYVSSGKFPPFLLDYNQPHNIYLFALATNGLIGLAALLYIFYRILKITVPIMLPAGGEKGRLFAFLAVATAIHFLIAGLTDSFFNIQILRYAFAFIMGVCVRQSVISARSS